MATMARVQIEVESGASRFRVSVRAATIGRALHLVGTRNPGASVRAVLAKPETPHVQGAERQETLGAETTGSAA